MNVAFILKSGGLSGTEKRSTKIASALNLHGHRVVLFMDPVTHSALTGRDYDFEWPPIVVWSYPTWFRWLGYKRKRFAGLRNLVGLSKLDLWLRRKYWARLLQENEIDLAHIYLDRLLCPEIPIPHLFEITSPDMARRIIAKGPPFPPETLLHPNSESVDVVLAGHFEENEKVVAPHAYFDPNEAPDFVPPEKENLVVFGHRLVARKNPLTFAKAAKRFLVAHPDWKVAIRGEGPLTEDVRAVLSEEIGSGRVLFGFTPNLMEELHRSRIFVSIESEDNYSNQSVLEAMWCHNALVLSDRGRTKARYFADNGNLCEPEEEPVLAALNALADDPSGLAQAAQNGRKHVETTFSREAYLDHLESLYGRVLKFNG